MSGWLWLTVEQVLLMSGRRVEISIVGNTESDLRSKDIDLI